MSEQFFQYKYKIYILIDGCFYWSILGRQDYRVEVDCDFVNSHKKVIHGRLCDVNAYRRNAKYEHKMRWSINLGELNIIRSTTTLCKIFPHDELIWIKSDWVEAALDMASKEFKYYGYQVSLILAQTVVH